ncbi:MAG TPA: serine hydrolase [Gemmatimonadaceae bacterium]|nr:serine hydrolase [Gemmatimonadaceae bacterium]
MTHGCGRTRWQGGAWRATVAATLVALSSTPAMAQKGKAGGDAARFAKLDAYVAATMKAWKVPGIALAIVKDDSIVYAKGFGTRTVGKDEPVDANTVFAIGSASKAFTAALVAMAVDEGKMKWDEKVSSYLPGFQLYDNYASRELTVRDALSHRSGLSRGDFAWYLGGFDRADILRRVRYLAPTWSFRSTFGYQNIMYLAAGEAVAAAERQSWDDQVRSKIFAPLGMTSSSTSVKALEGRPNVATPHYLLNDTLVTAPYKNIDNIAPAGSINSTVRDMAQWLRLQLGRGKYAGKQLISSGNHGDMWQPNIHIRLDGPQALYMAPGANLQSYGMGWFLQDFNGRLAVHHGGNIDGMSAMVAMLPEEQLGVVVLTNLNGTPAQGTLFAYAFDLFTRETPRDWNADYLKLVGPLTDAAKKAEEALEKARVAGTKPSLALDKYVGTYNDSLYGDIVVSAKDGGLRFQFGRFGGTLEHWHYDSFRGVLDNRTLGKPMITFVVDAAGKPAELKLEIAPEAKFRFTPQPADTRPAVALTDEQLQGLVGTYRPDQLPLEVQVQVVGGALKLTVPGQPTYTLVAVTATRFRMTGPPGMPDGFFVEFDVTNGKATGMTLVQPAPQPSLKLKRQ